MSIYIILLSLLTPELSAPYYWARAESQFVLVAGSQVWKSSDVDSEIHMLGPDCRRPSILRCNRKNCGLDSSSYIDTCRFRARVLAWLSRQKFPDNWLWRSDGNHHQFVAVNAPTRPYARVTEESILCLCQWPSRHAFAVQRCKAASDMSSFIRRLGFGRSLGCIEKLMPFNYPSSDGRRKASLEDAVSRNPAHMRQMGSSVLKDQPWTVGWQVSERNLSWNNDLAARLVKVSASACKPPRGWHCLIQSRDLAEGTCSPKLLLLHDSECRRLPCSLSGVPQTNHISSPMFAFGH